MFSKYALKAAAALNPDAAKLNLLKRVRELFKKIKEINDQNIDVNEKDGQISELLDATEQGETKPNIELFGPKTYLVKNEIDEPEKAVSILNYLPQFKTTCLETIGTEKYDKKMMETIDYLSKNANKRTVALIATKINERYSNMAGFTELKVKSIQEKCQDIIDVIEDDEFHAKSDMLETTIVNGPIIYSDYKDKDNQKEAAKEKDDLTAEMESLTIDPNKKASGGKRKTKRKNKKSKKSSRKKRKHRKTRKSKK